jgi:hypothetical protein
MLVKDGGILLDKLLFVKKEYFKASYLVKFKVVILGVRRLTGKRNGRAGMPIHYAGRKPSVLNIFSKYSLKMP